MREGKRTAKTHLPIIPLVSPPLRSHQGSIQPPITKRRNGLAFYSSEIHRLYIRTQFGLVMRLRLCISPCRQPNLQLPAHMGALAGRLRGNRLAKVLPSFIWKGCGGAKKEKKREDCGGSPRVIFSTRPWEISEIWGQGCFLTRALNIRSPPPPHLCGSLRAKMKDLTERRTRRLSAPPTLGSIILPCLFVLFLLFALWRVQLCRLPFKDTSPLPHVKF